MKTLKKNLDSNSRKIKSKKLDKSNNTTIIYILTLVKDYYKEQNDKFRIKTYERAIYQIRKWDKPITKGSDLAHLEGIGKGIIEKIDTIIHSGTLPIIKEKNIVERGERGARGDSIVHSILGFNKKFINDIKNKYNARTINDFRKVIMDLDSKLTHIQHIGLKYYEDLNDLIPRDEITYLGNKIKNIIMKGNERNESNATYTVFLAGSYPSHSKEFSKDIDIIIARKRNNNDGSGVSNYDELKNIIMQIKKNMGLEIISLGEKKFMGLVQSNKNPKNPNSPNSIMRHIDIRLVSMEELPYTWLYYSSGQIFNKLIRDKLKKKGYKLNEYGLFKNNKKVDINVNPEDYNNDYDYNYIEKVEIEIFKIADMEYKNVKARY